MLEFRASVMKVGNGLLITLPKPVCDGFKIKKGDTLTLQVHDDKIEIPIKLKKDAAYSREVQKYR